MTDPRPVAAWALAAVAVVVASQGSTDGAAVAWLTLLVVPGTLRGLVAAIAVGAVVLGAVAAAAVTVVGGPLSPTVAAGVGAAVGGGVGSAVWLFVGEDAEAADTDVTVDVGEAAAPAPQPADLFEANPDPILFVAGDDPAVLAANPAFGDRFGVDPDTLEGRPLADSLPAADGAEEVVAAVTGGTAFEATVACETADGPARVRVRVVPTGGAHGASYVLFGPLDLDG